MQSEEMGMKRKEKICVLSRGGSLSLGPGCWRHLSRSCHPKQLMASVLGTTGAVSQLPSHLATGTGLAWVAVSWWRERKLFWTLAITSFSSWGLSSPKGSERFVVSGKMPSSWSPVSCTGCSKLCVHHTGTGLPTDPTVPYVCRGGAWHCRCLVC